jgi:4-hydroxy-tetrahydrodipicolinate reductase
MKIALIGYGKMGKAIEKIALSRGHEIVARLDEHSVSELTTLSAQNCDVAIEFSQPESALQNIQTCLSNGIKVISGTTGWLESKNQIEELAREKNGTFLHSSNFSLGVNIFFELNKWLAQKMKGRESYRVSMEEIHHLEKKDSPSGTALRLVDGIQEGNPETQGWSHGETTDQTKIGIISKREPNVPGTHTVVYSSPMESIEIKHTAHSRNIFAEGAVDVAEWISDKSGVLTMNEYLNDLN